MTNIKNQSCSLLYVLVILLLPKHHSNAQAIESQEGSSVYPSVQIPPSPEVSSINKFIDLPVSYHTGTADISIPIFNLVSRDISVPIAIKYHGGGIKVNEIASNVGLGWSLQASGSVSRVVNKYPDEDASVTNIRKVFSNENEITNFLNTIDIDEHRSLERLYRNEYETDPDLFYLNYPGYGGKLFLDNNDAFVPMPYSPIKVWRQLDGFRVFDPNGLLYTFDEPETQDAHVAGGGGSLNSWNIDFSNFNFTYHLSSITSQKGGHINFEYETYSYRYYSDFSQSAQRFGNVAPVQESTTWNETNIVEGKRIKSITSSTGYEVVFNYDPSHRNDLPNTAVPGKEAGKLNEIVIKYEGEVITTYTLTHTYSFATAGNRNSISSYSDNIPMDIGAASQRLMLTSIQQRGDEPYIFTYNNRSLPNRFSYARDYWGYFNGATDNNTLIPDKHPDPALTSLIDYIPGGNRKANAGFIQANMLTSITYPNKGVAEFTYEGNSVIQTADGDTCIDEYSSDELEYAATATGESYTTLTETFTIPSNALNIRFYYHSNAEFATTALDLEFGKSYSEAVMEWMENGVLVSHPLIGQGNEFVPDPVIAIIPDREYTIHLKAWGFTTTYLPEEQAYAPASAGIRIVWDVVNTLCESSATSTTGIGGVRLASLIYQPDPQSQYNDGDNRVIRRFSYESPVFDFPAFNSISKSWRFEDETPFMADHQSKSSNSIRSTNTLFGSSVAYNKVTVFYGGESEPLGTDSFGGETSNLLEEALDNGKSEYYYDHVKDVQKIDFLHGFSVSEDFSWQRGQLKAEAHYRYNEQQNKYQIISQKNYTYLIDPTHNYTIWGVKPYITKPELMGTNKYPGVLAEYGFLSFQIRSRWYKLTDENETTFHYNGANLAGSTASSTVYQYNPENLLTKRVTTSFEDKTTIVDYKYSLDYASTPSWIPNALVEQRTSILERDVYQNLNSTVKEVEKIVSSVIYDHQGPNISGIYQLETEQPMLTADFPVHSTSNGKYTSIFPGSTASPLYRKVREYSYDQVNNIIKMKDLSTGQFQQYRYGYNLALPIATCIAGSDSEAIFYTSFETDGSVFSNSKSGERVLNSGNYTISNTDVPPSAEGTLKMSYWYYASGVWHFSGEQDFQRTINSGGTKLDEIRVFPDGALMTTYTHKPGIGVSSVTNPNGQTMRYHYYPESNRLRSVIDHEGNLVQRFEYNFAK